MAFDPAKRPQSAEELKLSLQSELSVERHSRRWIRAHRRLSWTALLLGLTVTGLFVYEVATRDDYYIRQLRLGSLAVEQGQYTEAVDHYSAAVDSFEDVPHSHPGRVGSLFARGRALLQAEEFTAAYRDFRKVSQFVDDGRNSACVGYALAQMANQDKLLSRYRAAIAHLKLAIEQGFAPATVYHNIGYCHLQLRELDLAEARFHESLTRDDELQTTHHCLGLLDRLTAAREGRLPDFRHIERALDLGPGSAQIYFDAARVYALAARQSRKQDQLEELGGYVELILEYCEQAIAAGMPRSLLKETLLTYYPDLQLEPRFRALPSSPNSEPTIWVGLVDPLNRLHRSLELAKN